MPTAVDVSPATSTLRLAVIEFETPPTDVFENHGTYGDVVIKLLRRTLPSATDHAPALRVTKVSALEDEVWPNVDEIDAVLVTGSKYTASDDNPWVPSLVGFIQKTYQARKPLAGICYGHQIIARALGGLTTRNPGGWELSVHKVDLSPKGAKLFSTDSLSIYQMHRDAVIETPPHVEVIGSSPRCGVQIMYQPGRVLGFQGHPEFDRLITESLLKQRLDEGILEVPLYEDAMARVENKHDGAMIAKVMCKFFLGS
ncbi:hypothetical protein FDECE_8963 [Fusarium decemcellulare]|nr:hypothetical protein FDECE_8963 [Fusarium decemcellulare]